MKKNIDGFMRVRAADSGPTVLKNKTAAKPKKAALKNFRAGSKAPNASAVHSTRTKKTKTLVRASLVKPLKTHISADIRNVPIINKLTPSVEYQQEAVHPIPVDAARLKRAQKTPLLNNISRFGGTLSAPLLAKAELETPRVAKPENENVKTIQEQPPMTILPSTMTSSHAHLSKMLSEAMSSANSHKLKHPKKIKKSRLSSGLSAGAAGLLLFGFFAYQNIPNMSVRIASSRSGVKASMPGYRPPGFALQGPVQYSAGSLSINFRANADKDRGYSLTERSTNWNNDSLASEFLAANGQNFSITMEKGRTIYIYGSNNSATWIDKGTWYIVQNNASLNSDQLLKIVSSI